jgi:hypothetical protein
MSKKEAKVHYGVARNQRFIAVKRPACSDGALNGAQVSLDPKQVTCGRCRLMLTVKGLK